MRATKHAPRGPFRLLKRRYGFAEIVERGARVFEHLLDHLHAVEDGAKIHVGAYAILRMFDACHAPYPLAAKLGRLLPKGPVDAIGRTRAATSSRSRSRELS